ncbi:MAG: T9SS type A sorting domain-containing protein, partial [Ignavibacteria bacterium]|nr:T9SS type A sorting domain-containing protein [Ignavibacteria bacterium]
NDNYDWEKISFVPGHGTTTANKNYFFTDENVLPGIFSYRLKQIDFDGSFSYSEIIEVEVTAPLVFSLDQNYPNPFNPTTNIKFRIADFGYVNLIVYDVLGNEVTTLVNEEKPAGNYEVEFHSTVNNRQLVSGIYYYQLRSGNIVETKKMVLLR